VLEFDFRAVKQFVLPSTGFEPEPTPLIHCSTIRLAYVQRPTPLDHIHSLYINSPTKVKHHLTCFNNIFFNNELISNRFAVFVTCTHILIYLLNRLLLDFYLCVYDRLCKVIRVLFNICICERKLIIFV
jgi:hypothetical protein